MRIERAEILEKIEKFADDIFSLVRSNEKHYVLLGVRDAAIWFTLDVAAALRRRSLGVGHEIYWADAKSYTGTERRAVTALLPKLPANCTPIVLDTICDSGETMRVIKAALDDMGHECVTAALLSKGNFAPDYSLIALPDPSPFLIGYGLDYNGEHRALEFISEFGAEGWDEGR
jgi:hypoxanthine-guanine phosphoribosyltransferase